ncbi:MAG: IS91 family transposase, partial [bacterium]
LAVPHRHLTFTLPDKLWPLVKKHREPLMKAMMDAVIRTLDEVLGPMIRGRGPKRSGAIVVLHPFGRDLKFHPHVHVICPEGAFEGERFVPRTFFPMDAFRKTWKYHVLTGFRKALRKKGKDAEAEALIDKAFQENKDGFYVHVTKETRIQDPDKVVRYVGRYVRHPAIAESRLVGYDGQRVTFRWVDHKTGARKQRTLPVDEFIEALLQHVPERHFKMVRYYGVYSRSLMARFRRVAGLWSMKQATLGDFGAPKRRGREVRCPKCGAVMDFVLYDRPPPMASVSFGSKLDDWRYLPVSPGKAVAGSS